jgi:hypothetical protein
MITADFHLSTPRTRISPHHYHRIGDAKLQALHTRANKHYRKTAFVTVLQQKFEGTAFASSTKQQDIPCIIIGGDREPSRATIDVHSLPVLFVVFVSTFDREHLFLLWFSCFFFASTDLYGDFFFFYSYTHLLLEIRHWRETVQRKEKLDVRFLGFASFAQSLWCVCVFRQSSPHGACRVWVEYTRQL